MARTKPHAPVPSQYRRPWRLEVYKSGEVAIRHKDQPMPAGVLPLASADTQAQAEALCVRFCVLERHDNKTYRLNLRYRNGGAHMIAFSELDQLAELFENAIPTLPEDVRGDAHPAR